MNWFLSERTGRMPFVSPSQQRQSTGKTHICHKCLDDRMSGTGSVAGFRLVKLIIVWMVIWGAVYCLVAWMRNWVMLLQGFESHSGLVSNQCADVTCLSVSHNQLIPLVAMQQYWLVVGRLLDGCIGRLLLSVSLTTSSRLSSTPQLLGLCSLCYDFRILCLLVWLTVITTQTYPVVYFLLSNKFTTFYINSIESYKRVILCSLNKRISSRRKLGVWNQ